MTKEEVIKYLNNFDNLVFTADEDENEMLKLFAFPALYFNYYKNDQDIQEAIGAVLQKEQISQIVSFIKSLTEVDKLNLINQIFSKHGKAFVAFLLNDQNKEQFISDNIPLDEMKVMFIASMDSDNRKLDFLRTKQLDFGIEVIISTLQNDEAKITAMREFSISTYNIVEIIKTLSTDEIKMQTAVLFNLDKYSIIKIIKTLSNDEIKMQTALKYNLDEYDIVGIIKTLSTDEIKIESALKFKLYESNIAEIISTLSTDEAKIVAIGKFNLDEYNISRIINVLSTDEAKIKAIRQFNISNYNATKEVLSNLESTTLIIDFLKNIFVGNEELVMSYLMFLERNDASLIIKEMNETIKPYLCQKYELNPANYDFVISTFGYDIVRYIQTNNSLIQFIKSSGNDINALLNLCIDVQEYEIKEKLIVMLSQKIGKDVNVLKNMFDMLISYRYDKKQLFINCNTVYEFLNKVDISPNKFFQYAAGSNYNWLEDLLSNNMNFDQFKVFYDYYSKLNTESKNHSLIIKNLLVAIKNYNRYPELCNSLANSSQTLSLTEQEQLNYLFSSSITLTNKPSTISDLNQIKLTIKEAYLDELKMNANLENIDLLKNIICKALFNMDLKESENTLVTYGNVESLKLLAFNDRKHLEVTSAINDIMIYISMIEAIVNNNNKEQLAALANNIANNFDKSMNISIKFSSLEEKLRHFFEIEAQTMLTNISNPNINKEMFQDIEKSNQYGVETIDFSDKEYILLGHVKSGSESFEQIINGEADGKSNFISLSVVSYRNQKYYYNGRNIIFGYDTLPTGNFICSSSQNMGSNAAVSENSAEVGTIYRTQKGLLETSDVEHSNSELLCFREGMKPSYIILPGGRAPSAEEIEIASKNGLKFAVTQELNKSIKNPKPINYYSQKFENSKENLADIKQLQQKINYSNPKRQVVIFSDSHALYEPTLAILEDARRKGITEIYSLGDNIGTGPNPGEVIDLLNEYNVKTILGNHEMYAIFGIDDFKEHLEKTGAVAETIENSTWTRNQLNEIQIKNLKLSEKAFDLVIGGKKIKLCHSVNDYNSDRKVIDLGDYDATFQGHIHFENEQDNLYTLQGAGIGGPSGEAYYVVLTEKEDGFDIEKVTIPYNLRNTISSINVSDLPQKDKITQWAKGR